MNELLGDLHWAVCCIGMGASLLFAVATELRRRRVDAAEPPATLPPLDLLKPFDGNDPGLEANFRAALSAGYPAPRQVLFATSADNHAGVALVQRLLAEPLPAGVTAQLLLPDVDDAPWPARKAWHLRRCEEHLTGEVAVISDSGTLLADDTLPGVVGTLMAEPRRGIAWAPYAVAGRGFGARLTRAIWTAGAASTSVLDAERALYGRARLPAGGLLAIRRDVLGVAGGFEQLADHIADDFALGRAVGAAGFAVVPTRRPIVRDLGDSSFGSAWRRQLRWAVALWASRNPALPIYPLFAGGLALAPFTAVLAIAAFPDRALEYGAALGGLVVARGLLGVHLRHRILGRPASWDLLLLPLGDAVLLAAWAAAPFVRTLGWRGRRVAVGRDGRLRAVD